MLLALLALLLRHVKHVLVDSGSIPNWLPLTPGCIVLARERDRTQDGQRGQYDL